MKALILIFVSTIMFGLNSLYAQTVFLNDAELTAHGATGAFPFPSIDIKLENSIPSGQGLLAIFINVLGEGTFDFNFGAIAEPNKFYLGEVGQVFDVDFVNSTPPFASNFGPPDPNTAEIFFEENETMIFAYWDDRSLFDGDPFELREVADKGDLFGWLSLTFDGDTLILNESVTVQGQGVIVGTAIPVIPEPAIFAFVVSVVSLGFVVLKQRLRPSQEKSA